ncbi:phosphoribosylformylglycinamidine cyclo-ligase [Candidatus Thorarchaeota archaeon]|nr:MAG: phosphoribosylformylglycinamidine cyclo-ligase [Candidatus Thorarchaeota archaeon]
MVDVLVIAGSKSDSKIVDKATEVLDDLSITYDLAYASAHREPNVVKEIVEQTDAHVIIAIAGLAAALPGVVASLTERPVIGVPVSAALGGLDALLSIAQMPKGVPVATVGIDNGQNAAHLAARILGIQQRPRLKAPSSYAEAGVDESQVSDGLRVLGNYVRQSFEHGRVMQDYGHYANAVQVSEDLCIALSTDGVGSKMLVAEMAGKYDTVGFDCVAMNVNDLVSVGMLPIGFVDYLAAEEPLPEDILHQIGQSLLSACRLSGIPILGGETAILPDMIKGASGIGIDLAGAAVGLGHPSELIDGSNVENGDAILGVSSNGIHSNGFTLARKVIFAQMKIDDEFPWGTKVSDELLRPTRIYVPHLRALREKGVKLHGIAHITGSGFKKILRLKAARFRITSFPEIEPVFSYLQEIGQIEWKEMFSTFNMSVGLVVIVPSEEKEAALRVLSELDESYDLGFVEEADRGSVVIEPYEVELE